IRYRYEPQPSSHLFPTRRSSDLATSAARPPRSSALLLSIACAVYVKFSPSRSNGRALRMFTVPAAPPSSIDADGDFDTVSCVNRSEEHTSELQSRVKLLCRLLRE